MLEWVIAAVLGVSAWLLWIVLEELTGTVISAVTAPVRRPIRDTFIRARRPWPLLLLLGVGLAAAATGVWTMARGEPHWVGPVGFLLFLTGSGIVISAPLLWRDARRQRVKSISRLVRSKDEG
jgi:hypothetical protein